MDGPWYESQGPDMTYVKNDIHRNIDTYLLRFPQITREFIEKILDDEIQREHNKYGGFGSFRGYATFTRRGITEGIEDKLKEKAAEIDNAFCKFKNNVILNNWINYILYRPPTETHKKGLRYNSIKKEFESYVESF